MTSEQQTKLKQLQNAKVQAEKNLLSAVLTGKEFIPFKDALDKAVKELDAYEDSLVTPEQREAQKAYDKALEAFNAAKDVFDAAKDKLKALNPSAVKSERTSRTHDEGYALAQEIRRHLAPTTTTDGKLTGLGMTNAELEKSEFGKANKLNNGNISPIKNYRVHKLKEGDFAWLPVPTNA